MKNETITKRQAYIYRALERASRPLSREEIEKEMEARYEVSKVTVLRDLEKLEDNELILVNENGPMTNYEVREKNELLKYIDADDYFAREVDERELNKESNEIFIEKLTQGNLFSQREVAKLAKINQTFQEHLANMEPEIYQKEWRRFTIELAYKSSRIEGNTYSLLETENLINNAAYAQGHTREEAQMILNHKTAMEMILQNLVTFRVLNMSDILALHQVLVTDLGVKSGIRTAAVGITGTNYLPADNQFQIREDMEKIIEVVNAKEEIIEKALIISGMIAYLQPFNDGNKRTARMVANALLLANGWLALSYRGVDEIEYKRGVLLIDEQHNFYEYKKMFREQFELAAEKYFV